MTIKRYERTFGFTQREIAKRAGISRAALSQMGKSTKELRTATLEKLARAMASPLNNYEIELEHILFLINNCIF